MTPLQFYNTLEELGWSYAHLARLLKCDSKLPKRWARGVAAIPPSIAEWLTDLAVYHEDRPPPDDWRVL